MQPTTGQARPQGVTILAVLAAIGGVLGLLAGIFALGIGGAVAALPGPGRSADSSACSASSRSPRASWHSRSRTAPGRSSRGHGCSGIVAFGISLVLAVLNIVNGDFTGQIISA